MQTRFTEKQLLRLNLSVDKIKTILEFQDKLPILLEDSDSWIDARTLWEHLHVKDKYTQWIKQQIKDFFSCYVRNFIHKRNFSF